MAKQVPATWMADVLRAAGLKVVEYPGWMKAGRPASKGPFKAVAIVMHHDASAKGSSPGEPLYLMHGRPPADPGPLCHCWVDYNGTWYVLAAGRTNHAGIGQGWGIIKANTGNDCAIGVEWDHTTGELVMPDTYTSIVHGLAALLSHMKANPQIALAGHKEYTTRKTDPDLSMNKLRSDVEKQMHPERLVSVTAVKAGAPCPDILHVAQALYSLGYHNLNRTDNWGTGKQHAYNRYSHHPLKPVIPGHKPQVGPAWLTKLGKEAKAPYKYRTI